MNFFSSYQAVLDRLDTIDPLSYGKTRNFISGDVTYLSPYISRGVISAKQVLEMLMDKGYKISEMEKFIQQLAWREYFQRVWQHIGDDLFDDIRLRYTGIKHDDIPAALLNAATGIKAVDGAIATLYETGYMHNHTRMYTASIACNIGKAHWQMPSQWMYYHLLDGDLASNTCSWQWVAGTFSSKQYFCNQENINKYSGSVQNGTFLDKTYEELPLMDIPAALRPTTTLALKTTLPEKILPDTDPSLPLLLYTSYNLDPQWRKEIKANRVLLLEPSHFRQFPVSEKVIDFILHQARQIEGLQVFTGEVNEIPGLQQFPAIYSKEHPAFIHFPGIKEERDWIFPDIKGSFNSFFSFWKKCERDLRKREKLIPVSQRA
ncbi:MAG: hypothetical protein JNM19_10305 [Chitinophagaceae bacterium]|nr:hypothetical protein [Chitinophagaceae bacterium]